MPRRKKIRIGIVGCGAIGSYLAKTINSDFKDSAKLTSIYDINLEKVYSLGSVLKKKSIISTSLENLIKRCDLVIEAATSSISKDVLRSVVKAKKDCMIMSVGGLIDAQEIIEEAKRKRCHIYIPSGAICGIDGIKAASLSKIEKIILTTRKPPSAFTGSPYVLKNDIRLSKIKEETTLFEGDVDTAVRLFPQNINVAATLSLASNCKEKITVRIITSPEYKNNIHEIEVYGESGKIFTRTENIPSPDNPKTSFLSVLSAVTTLKNILDVVKIGT